MTTGTAQKCIPGCNRPPTGKGTYPYLCWGHTPGEQDCFPVIVEYTHRHVVWVPAEDRAAAVKTLQDAAYEYTDDQETLVEAGWSANAPKDSWDWRDVYEGGYFHPYQELDCNAHVETRRNHLYRMGRLELEAWVENENRDQAAGRLAPENRRTCPMCPSWLEPGHADTPMHAMSQRRVDYEAKRAVETVAATGGVL